ncbi:MAG: O-antigen ligase family protein [Solirubrobacterales bacterium]
MMFPALHSSDTDRNAAALIALACCIGAITSSLSELLHFRFSSLHTAMSMYLPVLAALGILLASAARTRGRLPQARSWVILVFFCGFWLVNYLFESVSLSQSNLSDFDRKRMWFFVQAVLLSGLLGTLAARRGEGFIRPFLGSLCLVSAMASVLYLLNYRPNATFTRLLGERALGSAMVASFGLASCLAMLLLGSEGDNRLSRSTFAMLIAAIVVNVAAVVLSATRGAALCCLASAAAFMWMMRRSKTLLFLIAALAVISYGMVHLARIYVPKATWNRLMMQQYGFNLRYELSSTILDMIASYPGGKIFGYDRTNLGMDYSHNAILQYIAEAGLQSLPALTVLFCIAIWNLISHRADLHVRAMALLGLPVLIESCSGGSAYNFLLWFLLFFTFSLRQERRCVSEEELSICAPWAGRQRAPSARGAASEELT